MLITNSCAAPWNEAISTNSYLYYIVVLISLMYVLLCPVVDSCYLQTVNNSGNNNPINCASLAADHL